MVRRLIAVFLALAIAAAAQEADLANRIFTGTDPAQQLTLLQQWEAQYPKTNFERQRLTFFAMALQRVGRLDEAFTRATELLNLNPEAPASQLLIAMLGPKLPTASPDQIAIVEASANKLLAPKPHRPPEPGPTLISDAETGQVVSFVEALRKRSAPRPQPEAFPRQVAEAALEWAKNVKR